jgi:hypothetical protein
MQTPPEMKALIITFEAQSVSVCNPSRFADCLDDLRLHAHLKRRAAHCLVEHRPKNMSCRASVGVRLTEVCAASQPFGKLQLSHRRQRYSHVHAPQVRLHQLPRIWRASAVEQSRPAFDYLCGRTVISHRTLTFSQDNMTVIQETGSGNVAHPKISHSSSSPPTTC